MTQVTFCFVDIAGYTALTQTHGARASADLIERFLDLVAANPPPEVTLVDRAGDEVLVVAHSARGALQFVGDLFSACGAEPNFPVLRAGIHTGTALERDGQYFGAAVNLAARVAAQAAGGQVLATAETIGHLPDAQVDSLGAVDLKNVPAPVELFSIDVGQGDPAQTVVDPVCKMRVTPSAACGRLRSGGTTYWFCSTECARLFAENTAAYSGGDVEPRPSPEPRFPVRWGRVLLLVVQWIFSTSCTA